MAGNFCRLPFFNSKWSWAMKIKFIIMTTMQLVIPALAFAYDDQYGRGQGMMGWGYSMGWPMGIFMLLFWGAVLLGIIFLMRSFFSKNGQGQNLTAETPLDILKKRYAKGEIDQEEFEAKKRVLEE